MPLTIAAGRQPPQVVPRVAAPPFLTSVSPIAPHYPLDQYGNPYFMAGDSGWGLGVNVSPSDMVNYLSTRQSQGFNLSLVELVADTYSSISPNNAQTYDGINAFTGTVAGPYPDLSTPNPAYWARIDIMVALAARYGITLLAVPCDCASSFGDSYCMSMVRANGTTACTNYGRFLGTRYGNAPNVVWMHGNDYGTAAPWGTDDQYVGNICQGIRATDFGSVHTAEILPGLSQSNGGYMAQSTLWPTICQLGQVYQQTPTEMILQYNSTPTMPIFIGEGAYDDGTSNTIANYNCRAQGYWVMLVGGGAGQIYGNTSLYKFQTGWQATMTTMAAGQFTYWQQMFAGIQWWKLVPDSGNTFLTSGFSSGSTISKAAVTADGSLGVAYCPAVNPTVAMTKMRGTTLCRWYNPVAGTFATIGSYPNTGSQTFTLPAVHADGANDYVLVMTA